MSALPVYQVDFIPVERRLNDRRVVLRNAQLGPTKLLPMRRMTCARRSDDCKQER